MPRRITHYCDELTIDLTTDQTSQLYEDNVIIVEDYVISRDTDGGIYVAERIKNTTIRVRENVEGEDE